jgi:flagellar M-ring protein FliF
VDKLRDDKVPFELSADGTTIKVPEKQVSQLRLQFAGMGMPSSGEIGYELFDKQTLGMTDFMQKMNFHRALEGEIARTISELDAVESARVHLVVPSPKLFEEDKKPPTASIVVQLKPGASLTQEQVQGIAYLTAFSVEGLEIQNITIVDMRGNMLTNMSSRDQMAGLSSTQLDYQHKVEQDLETKALALMQDILGSSKAQIKVTAKLNWNRIERTVENYDAERAATLSEERQESTGDPNSESGGGTSERSVTNYQVPKTIEKYVPEVGNVERISASVLIDGTYNVTKNPDGTETRAFVERTPQELQKFKTLVANAIGIDAKRNDEITVLSFPFSSQEEDLPQKSDGHSFWLKLIEKIILGLLLVGLFLLARSLIARVGQRYPALPAGETPAPALAAGEPAMMLVAGQPVPTTPAEVASAASTAAAATRQATGSAPHSKLAEQQNQVIFKGKPQTVVLEDSGPTVEALKHQELLRRTTEYILQRPENATQILRSWILDDAVEKQVR